VFCLAFKYHRKAAKMERFDNNASERIIPPKREGRHAERMQVAVQKSVNIMFPFEVRLF